MIHDLDLSGRLPGDSLREFHGAKGTEIYVVLSKDGSTVLKDPGMDRPWSSKNKKIAEHHAKQNNGYAVDLITAMKAVSSKTINLPPSMQQSPPPGFQ